MARFGDFRPLCRQTPSYPWCNLFFRQLQNNSPDDLTDNSSQAPVGINPTCAIPHVGVDGSIGNVANIVLCAVSIIFVLGLIVLTSRRKAAVGRVELRLFLVMYLLTLPFQLLTTGGFLDMGGTPLTVLTAIHAGLVATTFWLLVGNALVATQVVEDGTMSSVVPLGIFAIAFMAATTYVALDVGFTFTSALGPSDPPGDLNSIPLFVFTSIWPGAAALIYFVVMTYIVLAVLNEVRPIWYYLLAAVLFVLSQLDWFLLSNVICRGTSQRVDGSFIATLLETAAVGVLYLAWRGITEESWDEDAYYQ